MNDKKTSAYRRIVSSTAIFGSAQILNILVNIMLGGGEEKEKAKKK